MESPAWWHDLGETLGRLVGWVLRAVVGLWQGLGDAVHAFLAGLAAGIGLDQPGVVVWTILVIGVVLLVFAVRGFLRRRVLGPLILAALGSFLISTVLV